MTIVDLTQQATERPEFEEPITREVTTGEVVNAFVQQEGFIPNLASFVESTILGNFIPDNDYDPFEDMTGYEGYSEDLVGAQSREEMSFIKTRIDKELDQRDIISSGNLGQQLLGMVTTIATDPTTLIPIGGVAYKTYRKGGRILEGAAKTGATAAAIETGREAFFQQSQITRTFEESAMNIGAVTFLGALLGGASAGLSKKTIDELGKRLDNDLITPKDFDTDLSTAGAVQVGTTSVQEEIKGLKKTLKVFEKLPDFLTHPVIRTAISPSKVVRILSEKIADSSLIKNKNTAFIATEQSIETHVKSYDLMKFNFYKDMDKEWKAYNRKVKTQRNEGGIPTGEKLGSKPAGNMTYQEFAEQVGMASARNDDHIISEVSNVAKSARKNVFDPILKRSGEVGLLDNIDEISVKTAPTWIKRMYNIEKITTDRDNFKEIVLNDLLKNRQFSVDELAKLNARHGGAVDDLKKLQKEKNAFRKKNIKNITANDEATLVKLDEFDVRLRKISDVIPDKKILEKMEQLTFRSGQLDLELLSTADQLINRVTNATGGRLPYDNKLTEVAKGPPKVGVRGSAKARVWNIPDEVIEAYLIRDINAIVDSHIRTMAPDNEIMAKFGTLDIDVISKQIELEGG